MTDLLYAKFKKSIRASLRWMILLILSSTFFLIFSLLTYFDLLFINVSKNTSLQLTFALIIQAASMISIIVFLIQYLLDYKLIKHETYPIVNVVVSRFDFCWSGYEPMERIWFPVFAKSDTGERIKISVDETVKVGDQYNVAYLPRTKITVLKKVNRDL